MKFFLALGVLSVYTANPVSLSTASNVGIERQASQREHPVERDAVRTPLAEKTVADLTSVKRPPMKAWLVSEGHG